MSLSEYFNYRICKRKTSSNISLIEYYDTKTKTLTIPCTFNEKLKMSLGIQNLNITNERDFVHPSKNSKFNKSIYYLPNSITHLTFSDKFNQLIDYLPNSITHLHLSYYFNQKVNQLSNSITCLNFGYWFNQLIIYLILLRI